MWVWIIRLPLSPGEGSSQIIFFLFLNFNFRIFFTSVNTILQDSTGKYQNAVVRKIILFYLRHETDLKKFVPQQVKQVKQKNSFLKRGQVVKKVKIFHKRSNKNWESTIFQKKYFCPPTRILIFVNLRLRNDAILYYSVRLQQWYTFSNLQVYTYIFIWQLGIENKVVDLYPLKRELQYDRVGTGEKKIWHTPGCCYQPPKNVLQKW